MGTIEKRSEKASSQRSDTKAKKHVVVITFEEGKVPLVRFSSLSGLSMSTLEKGFAKAERVYYEQRARLIHKDRQEKAYGENGRGTSGRADSIAGDLSRKYANGS